MKYMLLTYLDEQHPLSEKGTVEVCPVIDIPGLPT